MRATLRRGRVLIPGNAKVGAAGAPIDMVFGPLEEGWDLDAMDTLTVSVLAGHTSRRGPAPGWLHHWTAAERRSKGPSQADVDALIASFG